MMMSILHKAALLKEFALDKTSSHSVTAIHSLNQFLNLPLSLHPCRVSTMKVEAAD